MTLPRPSEISIFHRPNYRKSRKDSTVHSPLIRSTDWPMSPGSVDSLSIPSQHLEYALPPPRPSILSSERSTKFVAGKGEGNGKGKGSFKRKVWLPVVLLFALASGSVFNSAEAQGQQLTFDSDCVYGCAGNYNSTAVTTCPTSEDENAAYDCTVKTCDSGTQAANMYVTGYLIQMAQANAQPCAAIGSSSSSSASASTASGSTSSVNPGEADTAAANGTHATSSTRATNGTLSTTTGLAGISTQAKATAGGTATPKASNTTTAAGGEGTGAESGAASGGVWNGVICAGAMALLAMSLTM